MITKAFNSPKASDNPSHIQITPLLLQHQMVPVHQTIKQVQHTYGI
jgi:hypothetical protein